MHVFNVHTSNAEDVEYDWNMVLWEELYNNNNNNNNMNLIEALIEKGVNPTKVFKIFENFTSTNLHTALHNSEPEIVDILLEGKNIKLDVKNSDGDPALFSIIRKDIIDSDGKKVDNHKIKLLKKLIGVGANINITNSKGNNFLMQLLASYIKTSSLLEIVNFLTSSTKLNVSLQNETGQNVFHILAKQGTVDHGFYCRTPYIEFGAIHHFKSIASTVLLLREKNSRLLEMPDYEGNKPLDIALGPFCLSYDKSYYENPGIYGSLDLPYYMPIGFTSLFISNEKRKDKFDKLQSYYLNKLNKFTKSLHSQQKKLSSDSDTNFEKKYRDLTDQLTTILKNPPETDVFECIADKIKKLTDKEAIKKNKDEIEKSFDLIVQLL